MKLLTFDIPDTHADTARWLEWHLVGMDLPSVVLELAAIHQADRPSDSVTALLGARLEVVLESGLTVLAPDELRPLLLQPYYLLELQTLVLVRGGRYWRNVETATEQKQRVEQNWRRLQPLWSSALPATRPIVPSTPAAPPAAVTSPAAPPVKRRGRWSLLWPWLLNLFTGVSVFIGCYVLLRWQGPPTQPPVQPADAVWGWNRPDALAPAASPQAYLNRQANLVEEWFQAAPNDPTALARRLLELRLGCTRLVFAEHPLPEAMNKAIQIRAAGWGKKVGDQLSALEAGVRPETVRQNTDRLVRDIAGALRSGDLD